MDVLSLSRIQFAATAMFHFLFVPLTIGLSVLVAWWETRYVRTGDDIRQKTTASPAPKRNGEGVNEIDPGAICVLIRLKTSAGASRTAL